MVVFIRAFCGSLSEWQDGTRMARIGFAGLPCVQTCRSVEKWKNGAKDWYVFRKRFVYKRNMYYFCALISPRR